MFQGPELFNSLSPEYHNASSIAEFLSKPKSLIFLCVNLVFFISFGAFSFLLLFFFSLFHNFYSCLLLITFYVINYCIGYLI